MRKFVLAVATAASIAGGVAATMALTSGTAVAQTPTQSPTPESTSPATPRRPCHHDQQSGSSGTPSTDTRIGFHTRNTTTRSV